jgi:secreted PhoX family phosphatase
MALDRRDFVKFLGGTVVASAAFQTSCTPSTKGITFSDKDDFILADGFSSDILISFRDRISAKDTFGANNDYTAIVPINGSSSEVIMWVNHEYPDLAFGSNWFNGAKRTKEMIDDERYSVGGSLLHLKLNNDKWGLVKDSKYNRRITGETKIPLISDREIEGSKVAEGTFANCAGGVTPWNTFLTCEENYFLFYGERDHPSRRVSESRLGWDSFYNNPPEHYGWVVEVDPFSGEAKKLTGLGRFSHECATCIRTKDGRVAVYSGDDKNSEFLYKFVSEEKDSLETGELFVANIKTGQWMSLDRSKSEVLKKNFKDQTDVNIYVRQAARLLGATELDRPEDIEINPKTGEVFVCLTNNTRKGNYHGSILKLSPADQDHGSLSFKAEDFLVGGEDFSCPDNMAFDSKGNLWFATDMSGGSMNKPPYTKFKNNGLFYVSMSGKEAGKVVQIASAPTDAELTGLSFAPDGRTLFLSVQHPGEKSKSLQEVTSHWPKGGDELPLSSVVSIRGPLITG